MLAETGWDHQSRAGAAVFARGRTIGLHKRLEQPPLILARNSDSAIAHLKGKQHVVTDLLRLRHRKGYFALAGQFDRVREQVVDNLPPAILRTAQISGDLCSPDPRTLSTLLSPRTDPLSYTS